MVPSICVLNFVQIGPGVFEILSNTESLLMPPGGKMAELIRLKTIGFCPVVPYIVVPSYMTIAQRIFELSSTAEIKMYLK